MKQRARIIGVPAFLFITSAATLLAQGAAAKARYTKWWLPDQLTESAGKVDSFFMLILWITSIVFIGVFGTMIYYLIRYRWRQGGKAIYSHGNNKLEIFWTATPAIILIVLGILSSKLWSEMKIEQPKAENSFIVEVSPRQFQWDVRYSGADGKFGTPDDITTVNTIHVPANKDVVLNLAAQDVIHSFFVPEFRLKQDAVPGLLTKFWFKCPKPDTLQVMCAELCGMGHGVMNKGQLMILEQSQFDAWYKSEIDKKAKEMNPSAAAAPASGGNDTTAGAAAAPPSAEQLEKVEVGKTMELEGVTFGSGSATLLPASEKTLENALKALKDKPDWVVEIQGHSDNSGKAASNLSLSQKRAQAVIDWLVKKGVDKSHLSAKGFGGDKPVADNSTEAGRAQNRRIEFARVK